MLCAGCCVTWSGWKLIFGKSGQITRFRKSNIFHYILRKFGMIIQRKHAFTQHRESKFDLLQIWRWNASCSDFVAKSRSRVRYSRNASLRCNQLYPKERCRGTKQNPASSYPVAFMTPTAQGCSRARRQSSEDVSAAHLNLRFNWENFFLASSA